MFISYVVPTYNCVDRVSMLEATVRALSSTDCEFCVSDGGSSDGTLEALKKIPNIRLLKSSQDLGIYDAWNKVLDRCLGQYISFIGVDDIPSLEFLNASKQFIKEIEITPKIIYGNMLLTRGGRTRLVKYQEKPKLFFSNNPVFDIPHPGLLNHKSLFLERQFDSSFKLAGDLHFYLALRKKVSENAVVYLDLVQASVDANGLSRGVKAAGIYYEEYERIEVEYNIKLGYSMQRLMRLKLLERIPFVFSLVRNISWFLRRF